MSHGYFHFPDISLNVTSNQRPRVKKPRYDTWTEHTHESSIASGLVVAVPSELHTVAVGRGRLTRRKAALVHGSEMLCGSRIPSGDVF